MRTPLVVLLGALLLAACGPSVIYVPATTPEPVTQPEPVEEPIPPVGVTVVREDGTRLLVSTNQPAYLAVFEIVPERGVALIYPASPRQRQAAHTGANWLNVYWQADRLSDGSSLSPRDRFQGVVGAVERSRPPVRYVYAVASYRPLQISSRTFAADYLRETLGARVFRAADPYETMAALARHFVPAQIDEDWGEDYLTAEIERRSSIVRVARVYCRDGSITYVRDEHAERAVCPLPGRRTGGMPTRPARPDSVVVSGGGRVTRPVGTRPVAPPPFRIARPPMAGAGPQQAGRPATGSPPAAHPPRGNGTADGDDREKSNNGRHNGWENGNRGVGNPNAGSNGNNGNRGTAGNAGSNGNRGAAGNNGTNGNNGSADSSRSTGNSSSTAKPTSPRRDTTTVRPAASQPLWRRGVTPPTQRPTQDSTAAKKPPAQDSTKSAEPEKKDEAQPPAKSSPASNGRRPVSPRRPVKSVPDSTADDGADQRGKRPATP